jgi:hypothetical protein
VEEFQSKVNRIGGVMVSVLASSAENHGFESLSGHGFESLSGHGFESLSGKTKNYTIGISCFSAKHAALRRKSKDWSTRNQNHANHYATNVHVQVKQRKEAATVGF